jgi:hypothetical protein
MHPAGGEASGFLVLARPEVLLKKNKNYFPFNKCTYL